MGNGTPRALGVSCDAMPYTRVVLCCVAHSYLVIKQIEGTCLFHCLSNIHWRYAKLYCHALEMMCMQQLPHTVLSSVAPNTMHMGTN